MTALICHPAFPPVAVTAVTARVLGWRDGWLRLRWRVEGAGGVVLPEFAGRGRADGLWRTTCFELFARRPGDNAYVELNFAPSEQWAAYRFTNCREGMAALAMAREPVIAARRGGGVLIVDVELRLDVVPGVEWELALTAVIEEAGGVLSYWAPVHPLERPDFHHPDCFVMRLAPPGLL